jgi:two-component system, chemotaxis family, CheB/CheR fusion protein
MVANHVAVTLERRRQEETLLERERHLEKTVAALKEQNRRKNQFLAMLGHELRNPLAAIRSATEALSAVGAANPRQARLHGVLDRQSAHMARLVDGLLEVSRLSRGRVQLACRPLDLAAMTRQMLTDRGGLGAERGLTLETDLGESAWVQGDPVRLTQVLDNLLSNAVKFTEPPGTVRVVVGREGDDVLVRVSDTGIGIEPELVEGLFEPFHQASQDLDRAAGGLGLGLTLVKGLVELHGGRVSAASGGPGLGAEITVRLPAVEPPAAAEEAHRRAPVRSLSILVVEDNRDTAEALQLLLQGAGHDVTVAYDGEEGLAAALRLQPDVVLCDIGLPGELSGYDVAQRLKAVEDGHSPRMVAITGYGRRTDRQRSFDSGFDEHLTKPVTLQMIHEALAELGDGVV